MTISARREGKRVNRLAAISPALHTLTHHHLLPSTKTANYSIFVGPRINTA